MTDTWEVTRTPAQQGALWCCVGLGVAGACLAALRIAFRGGHPGPWPAVGLFSLLVAVVALRARTARLSADAYGVHSRTLLRRRDTPWHHIADLGIQRGPKEIRRVSLVLHDGHEQVLPLLRNRQGQNGVAFNENLTALRALHGRYGTPGPGRVSVITSRTTGHGSAGTVLLCALLLAGAGLAVWFVPDTQSHAAAWRAATPCTPTTPRAERRECLATQPARIARTDVNGAKSTSWLYFADRRPLERIGVSRKAAQAFQPGDTVELTVWRGSVMKVAGTHFVWHDHVPGGGDVAGLAAALALGAGYPGALVLLRVRGRRLPDGEVLPSPVPFVGVLLGTALWLIPLCALHPTTLFSSPVAITWGSAGVAATLVMFALAWRATRIRTPEAAGAIEAARDSARNKEDVFLSARFLDDTDYNPHGFGTHIVLGDEPPAVTPHSGPGRFAAKRIPADRLTLTAVRRARGSDGDSVPHRWHIAELDDAGTPVRLAAAPDDLTRILRALDHATSTTGTATS